MVDWLTLGGEWEFEWLISPSIDGSVWSLFYYVDNKLSNGTDSGIGGANIVRPVLYLEHDIMIASGTGTQLDPYILN